MKVQILQENLSKAVSTCSRFTSSKVQLPILANVCLKTDKNKLLLSATNLEISISINIGAKVLKEGEITVPARILNEIVANLEPGQIDLEADKEILKIKTTSFESSVSGINSSDFPDIPKSAGIDSFKIISREVVDALSSVLFAVSVDETRPVLTGVLMIVNKNYLTMVSTDGFRLSQKKLKIQGIKEEKRYILPKGVLSELPRIIESGNVGFSYKKNDNLLVLDLDSTILSSRIIEGDFPDFERIIPKDTKIKIHLDRNEFLRSVKLAGVFAKDSANVIKLIVSKNSLEVAAESNQSGSQKKTVDSKIESNYSESFTIAFNYRFIEDFLNAARGDNVRMEFSDPNAPALFLDEKDSDFIHIIMPVRLQS